MSPKFSEWYMEWIDGYTELAKKQVAAINPGKLFPYWEYFKKCERELLKVGNHLLRDTVDEEEAGSGLALFAMNYMLRQEHTELFRSLGLPHSLIKPEMWEPGSGSLLDREAMGEGWVSKNGTLFADSPFAQLDPDWSIATITYLFKEMGLIRMHPFETPGTLVNQFQDEENVSVAVIGDWGTGTSWGDGKYKDPAHCVAEGIAALPQQPDIIIHLGDVYYAGLEGEEQRNLLPAFPKAKNGYNFTLNSNHETYNGANGYFKVALNDELFKHQGGKSYFAIPLKNWIIIGLDSSYYDKSLMVMEGAITDETNSHQQDFIASLDIPPGKKILLLTHHPAVSYDGLHINKLLVKQVHTALGDIYPDYWYYGHTHNAFVYNGKSAIGERTMLGEYKFSTRFHTFPKLRCAGHSSIPFGKAAIHSGNQGLDYYAQEKMPDPDEKQKKRLLNGFAILTLSGQRIQEQFYVASPLTGIKLAWQTKN